MEIVVMAEEILFSFFFSLSIWIYTTDLQLYSTRELDTSYTMAFSFLCPCMQPACDMHVP